MRGLRKPEGKKFDAFFRLVQHEAEKRNAVFFLDCGEGRDFETDSIEGEDLRGWLIPSEKADTFEKEWLTGNPADEWANEIAWAIWSGSAQKPTVEIKQF